MKAYQPRDEIALPGITPEDIAMIEETTGYELICKNGIWHAVQPKDGT